MKQPSINLTEAAANHVKVFLAERDSNAAGLRVGVKPTGCSGYQYVIEAAERIGGQDAVFESNGVKIVVDQRSLNYLAGCELDFVRRGLNSGFQFNNPNVRETCGCGESFSLKNEEKK